MPSIILSLRNGVTILELSEGGLELQAGSRTHRIEDAAPKTIQTLLRLFSNEISYAELLGLRGREDEPGEVWSCLERISRLGCLFWSSEAIQLEKQAQDYILENIRNAVKGYWIFSEKYGNFKS